jgi:hypothetical protein
VKPVLQLVGERRDDPTPVEDGVTCLVRDGVKSLPLFGRNRSKGAVSVRSTVFAKTEGSRTNLLKGSERREDMALWPAPVVRGLDDDLR